MARPLTHRLPSGRGTVRAVAAAPPMAGHWDPDRPGYSLGPHASVTARIEGEPAPASTADIGDAGEVAELVIAGLAPVKVGERWLLGSALVEVELVHDEPDATSAVLRTVIPGVAHPGDPVLVLYWRPPAVPG